MKVLNNFRDVFVNKLEIQKELQNVADSLSLAFKVPKVKVEYLIKLNNDNVNGRYIRNRKLIIIYSNNDGKILNFEQCVRTLIHEFVHHLGLKKHCAKFKDKELLLYLYYKLFLS